MAKKPELSVIIANRNDLQMLSVTVRSCIEELKPLGPGIGEVVICDNSDERIYNLLSSVIPSGYISDKIVKITRQSFPCLFTAREQAAREASGKYILCVDSHLLIGRDMILDLFNFMERKVGDPTVGFAHAPISWCHQHERAAKHDRDLSKDELGPWGRAHKEERTITWKGMPWICRREWFLDRKGGLGGYGALSEHKISWGGGDMHIGTKPWLLGFKNWAVPTSPGIHIGPFPEVDTKKGNREVTAVHQPGLNEYRYRLWSNSGFGPHSFGFLISCFVLGGQGMMRRNSKMIKERFGRYMNQDEWWEKAKELGANERKWLLDRQVISYNEFLTQKPWENGYASEKGIKQEGNLGEHQRTEALRTSGETGCGDSYGQSRQVA